MCTAAELRAMPSCAASSFCEMEGCCCKMRKISASRSVTKITAVQMFTL